MWAGTVEPALLAMMPDTATIVQRRIKCFGAGESAIEAMLPDLVRRGRDPLVGITAHEATITLRIAARGRTETECLEKIAPTEDIIRECLGSLAYGVEDDEIEDAVIAVMRERAATLATAEIGTAGRVAALLAQAQGRSPAGSGGFRGGRVLPGNPADDATTLAKAARAEWSASCGLAVSAVRPTMEGRLAVDIAIVDDAGVTVTEHVFGGGPDLAAARAAKTAINLVRLRLLAARKDA
jgi:nicotinamide-nucleotide amidase